MHELRKSAYVGAVWAVALGYGVAILPNTANGKAGSEGRVPLEQSGHILRLQASPGMLLVPSLSAMGEPGSEGRVPVEQSGHILRWQASPGMPLVHALFEHQSPGITESAILRRMAIGAWARYRGKHAILVRCTGKQANLGQIAGKAS